MIRFLSLLLLLVFGFGAKPALANTAILDDMAKQVIDLHIRPAYTKLHQDSLALQAKLNAFCKHPTATGLDGLKRQFSKTVFAFAAIEHIRFGPITRSYRLERFAYWPDRKGRGRRAVRLLIQKKDFASLKAETFQEKSVAVQGLTALEWLLFAKAEESSLLHSDFACAYAVAIGDNLANISAAVVEGWQAGAPIVRQLLNPGPDQIAYKNRQEVLQELYQSMIVGFNNLHNLKITLVIGAEGQRARPKRAAFWRSHSAVPVINQQFNSLKHMVAVSGYLMLLPEVDVDLHAHVKDIYRDIETRLDALLKNSIFEVVEDEKKRAQMQFVAARLQHLTAGFARNFAIAANLPLGFNATDGD